MTWCYWSTPALEQSCNYISTAITNICASSCLKLRWQPASMIKPTLFSPSPRSPGMLASVCCHACPDMFCKMGSNMTPTKVLSKEWCDHIQQCDYSCPCPSWPDGMQTSWKAQSTWLNHIQPTNWLALAKCKHGYQHKHFSATYDIVALQRWHWIKRKPCNYVISMSMPECTATWSNSMNNLYFQVQHTKLLTWQDKWTQKQQQYNRSDSKTNTNNGAMKDVGITVTRVTIKENKKEKY